MAEDFDRREFLKIAGLVALSMGMPGIHYRPAKGKASPDSPNILIFLFDTFSANHLSINGYPRETMPRLANFMENATVYHNHYASAPYTTPATASLLTGTEVWTHRSFQLDEETTDFFVKNNLFSKFTEFGYHTIGYTHNPHAEVLLTSMGAGINRHIELQELFLSEAPVLVELASNDFNTASQAYTRAFENSGMQNSLVLGQLLKNFEDIENPEVKKWQPYFPYGVPSLGPRKQRFVLEDAVDWISEQVPKTEMPLLGYFHFWPPHYPYHTRVEFHKTFQRDGYVPIEKPEHIFTRDQKYSDMVQERIHYDEYLLYIDAEFERIIKNLEAQGVLENSWVIFTSDHGELFERGVWGHRGLPLYQPVINVPLMIKAPGQSSRYDVFENTSVIDLLPTLLDVIGKDVPEWVEGTVLPPYHQGTYDAERAIFTFNPRRSDRTKPSDVAVVTITKGRYKLMYAYGVEELNGEELFELYDLVADPEELDNLYGKNDEVFNRLYTELKAKLDEVRNTVNL